VASVAIDKKNLGKLVAAMRKQGTVLGPVASGDEVVLAEINAKSVPELEFANFKLPLKREFFPQCEVVSRYNKNGPVEEAVMKGPVVLFGVRPCDTQSRSFLDMVFVDEKYKDPYYAKRRDNALVISLACPDPAATCFCMSTGGGPASRLGTDMLAVNLAKSLLLYPVSKKGEAFVNKNKSLFRKPTAAELKAQEKQESDSRKKMTSVEVSRAPGSLAKKNDPAFWEGLAETCLSCGACTFLCPTCHCFDLYEEKQETGSARLRVHDACMFPSFVREASGHNPRGRKGERMRQRIMHKFTYAPENFNAVFCVGCGRCVANCPSNIDVRETIALVNA
jgi:sulfhydrogenase subunit beta (sulfur reductase)